MSAQVNNAQNPIIFADESDISIIRVGNTYYISSATMHMVAGVFIVKQQESGNWEIVSYASANMGNVDAMNLNNGKSTYGRGLWASCMRCDKGIFYVSTFVPTTEKTYIYSTNDI